MMQAMPSKTAIPLNTIFSKITLNKETQRMTDFAIFIPKLLLKTLVFKFKLFLQIFDYIGIFVSTVT